MSKQLLCLLACVSFLCISAQVSKADLIAYWPFDEGTGDVAADVIGGNDAQLTDTAWTTASKMGSAAIDFAPGNVIDAGAGPTPTTEDLTLAWWMMDNHDSWGTLLSKSTDSSTKGYNILPRPSGEDSPLRFRIGGWQAYGGWGDECRLPQGAYEDGQWVHITCTYDSASDTATIYVNGEVIENGDYNPKTVIAGPGGYCEGLNNPDEPLYIAGNPEGFTGIIDEVAIWDHALTPDEIQSVLTFGPQMLEPGAASRPNPEDGAGDVPRDLTLTWTAGETAVARNAFLGTSLDDVSNASIADPLGTSVGQDLSNPEWNPGRLEFGQTYYWRVDEVNGPPDRTVFASNVWGFTVEPFSYPLENVSVSASSQQDNTMGPENTINGVGLNDMDQHSTEATEMWLSGAGDPTPSVQYAFDQAYALDKMLVWNHNQVIELFLGIGAQDVVVETSLDGANWTVLEGATQFAQATAGADYQANTTVDFAGAVARYVKITLLNNRSPFDQTGLSAVRFYYIPTFAREPQPVDGSTTDSADIILSWRSGRQAASSEVYLGTDAADLALLGTTTDNSLAATDVDLGTTYFWSVTEVNEAQVPASYASPVWRFTTPAYVVVDDFEAYDDNCKRIFFAWNDGLGHNGGADVEDCAEPASNGNGSGSIVGHGAAPFAERAIVNSGNQSMPLEYAGISETTLSLDDAQDWTASSIKALAIALRGAADNTGQLYIKINNTKVTYDGSLTQPNWQTWNIDLGTVGGNLSQVTSLTLGIEGAGAAGMLYIDDIRLYPQRCVPELGPAGDLNGDCVVDDADLAVLTNDWLVNYTAVDYTFDSGLEDNSGNAHHGIAQNNPVVANGVLTLNGSNWVDIPLGADNPFDGSQDFSIAMDFTAVSASILISSSQDDTPDNHSMAVYINTDGSVVYDNFWVGAASAGADSQDGEWHTLVVTYDADGPAVQAYLDGAPGGVGAFNPAIPAIAVNTVRIGSSLNKTFPYGASAVDLNGSVDNVRIFNFTLTPDDIMQLPVIPPGPADLDGDGTVTQADQDLIEANLGTEQLWP